MGAPIPQPPEALGRQLRGSRGAIPVNGAGSGPGDGGRGERRPEQRRCPVQGSVVAGPAGRRGRGAGGSGGSSSGSGSGAAGRGQVALPREGEEAARSSPPGPRPPRCPSAGSAGQQRRRRRPRPEEDMDEHNRTEAWHRSFQAVLAALNQSLHGLPLCGSDGAASAAVTHSTSTSTSTSARPGRHDNAFLYILFVMTLFAATVGSLILGYTRSRKVEKRSDPYHVYIKNRVSMI